MIRIKPKLQFKVFVLQLIIMSILKYNVNHQVVPAKVVEALLKACKSGNFDLANKEVNNFIAEGYPASQMLTQVLILFYWTCFIKTSTILLF